MVNHRKNDSQGRFAQQEALITYERVKQNEDEAERIHFTAGRMDTGLEMYRNRRSHSMANLRSIIPYTLCLSSLIQSNIPSSRHNFTSYFTPNIMPVKCKDKDNISLSESKIYQPKNRRSEVVVSYRLYVKMSKNKRDCETQTCMFRRLRKRNFKKDHVLKSNNFSDTEYC